MPLITASKTWNIPPPNLDLGRRLAQEIGVSPILAQILINRGIKNKKQGQDFLEMSLKRLHDPFQLKDMDLAVDRIRKARQKKERILIYGDYDVDGITSIALLQNTLIRLGHEVVHYIPHRIHDGYGLNQSVGKIARDRQAKLFISVDCGISAIREVDILNKAGVDVIVIDHHEPTGEQLPQAVAVVDPKRRDCTYPFKELAAVGLVMKLCQALEGVFVEDNLDLVALGTIADVVPLIGENRAIVKQGLRHIAQTTKVGLSALMEITKLSGKKIRPSTVGFILGPRLNATGRMDTAKRSLELLMSTDWQDALRLAAELDQFNQRRQKIQRSMINSAVDLVEKEVNFKEHRVIVVSQPGWHKGVLGIVASRIAEKYSRPAIVISLDAGIGSASARSVEGFHLVEALEHCASLLVEFGGHRLAAGLTIEEANIELFKKHINDFAKKIFPAAGLETAIEIDCEIPLRTAQDGLFQELALLEPYGEGNRVPLFCTCGLEVKGPPQVRARDTLKFWVTDGQTVLPVVGFGMGRYADMLAPAAKVDIVYQIDLNEWNGISSIQLKLKDIRSGDRSIN